MKRKTTASRFIAFLISIVLGVSVNAQVVYVDQSASGTGDGASWANAVTDLQAGIDLAATVATVSNPIQVWVKSGTYKTTTGTDRTVDFELKSYVELYGGFAGSETSLSQRNISSNPSTLSGDIGISSDLQDNSYSPFSYGSTFQGPIIINGFTISEFQDPTNQKSIGLITAASGATVTEVQYALCEFNDNEIGLGSIYGFMSEPTTFSSCKFFNNGGLNGILMWVAAGSLKVENSLFVGNNLVAYNQTGTLELINNTFYGNGNDVITLLDQPTPVTTFIYNNVFWANSGTDIQVNGTGSVNLTAENNLVQDPFTFGTNTVSSDPQFLDAANNDFRITNCSPAVDQGTNTPAAAITTDLFGSPRIFNTTIDLGAYENQVTPVGIAAIEIGPVQCAGGADGNISVNGGGGSGSPFLYSIDGTNFQSSGLFENLLEGTYEVSIRDTGGTCDYKENFEVTGPAPIQLAVSITSSATMNSLNVTASGGSAPYTYSLDGINFQSGALPITGTGNYTVYARDLVGCEVNKSYYITSAGNFVLFLDPNATGDGTGSSWTNAFTDLQAAIDSAALSGVVDNHTQVWTKAGTYYPDIQSTVDRDKTIKLRNNVSLYGGFNGTETEASQRDIQNNETILSGDIRTANDSTDNTYGMLTIGNDVTDGTKLNGWILEGAFSLGVQATNGAIHLIGDVGDVEIKNCIFRNNLANEGACIRMTGVTNTTSSVSVESTYFFNNGFYATSNYIGSALYVKNNVRVNNSLFIRNNSGLGGAIYLSGDGLSFEVANSTFYENGAGTAGAVLYDGTSTIPGSSISWFNNINWGDVGALAPIFVSSATTFSNGNNITIQALTGPNTISDDPQFFNESGYDLRIKHCSPAVDAGDDSKLPSSISEDINGEVRRFNTLDIGAFENQIQPIQISLVEKEDISCNGSVDGQIEVSATGGTGSALAYSIDGSTFVSTGAFTGLAVGNHTIYVSDPGNGCVVTETYTISQPDILDASATATDVVCNGQANGRISGTVTGGTAPFQIILSGTVMETGVTSTFDIGNLPPTTYTVAVTDDNGCLFTLASSLTIAEPAALSASAVVVDVLCNGDATGEITVTAAGGIAPYEYSIDGTNFQASNVFGSLLADAYTVTIRDDNGCLATINQSATEPAALTEIAISASHVTCNGLSDGSFSIGGAGGTTPYEYSLDGTTFQTNPLWENLAAGTYNLTIRDANGCLRTSVWTVTEPDVLAGSTTVSGTSSCGLSDGEIVVSITGGTSPYSYSLDGGTTTQASNTFSGLSAGAYTITVMDDNGCEIELIEGIDDPVTATVTTAQTDILCNGDATGSVTVTVIGGTTPITYSLNSGTPQSSNVFENLSAGTYSIEVREGNGCTQAVSVDILEPSAISASLSVSDVSCNGEASGEITVTASGGTGPYEYSIDGTTFQTSNVIGSLPADNYTVTIRDANGCTISSSEVIEEPATLMISVDAVSDASCQGQNDGSISVSAAGGAGSFEFSIDGGAFGTATDFTGLAAGSYEVKVRDANGCEAQLTEEISNQFTVVATTAAVDPLCNGDANGEITVSASGGVAPYEYFISGSFTSQSSPTFGGLAADTYVFRVVDANGCQASSTVELSEPQELAVQANGTDISCNGESDGQISTVASGGTSPYEYSIDGASFQSSPDFSGLSSGTYTITTTDANACSVIESVTIVEPDALSSQLGSTNASCNGVADGSISVAASGGTSPFEYSIDGTNFQSSVDFSGLAAGTYTVTTRDAGGCEVTESATITEPDLLEILVVQSSRDFTASASGGTSPYEYSSDGTSFQTSGSFADLAPGNYTFRVRDANGCVTSSDDFEIALSISDAENKVTTYPNPVVDYLIIESTQVKEVEVYDLNGKKQQVQSADRKVDMRDLSRGMYVIKMKGEDGEIISVSRVLKTN